MGNRLLCGSSMCPKATLNPGIETELFDDTSTCDPAGAIFNETLEDLNEVDRLLLQFASTSNLAAVRWLFVLGANPDACDTNGTTCLHTACRSGSLPIVQEFINRELPLDSTDVAGWTPLHVSLFMGRRSVAVLLMQNGADLHARNSRGQSPSELSSDVWLREAVSDCALHRQRHRRSGSSTVNEFPPWTPSSAMKPSNGDIQISSRLRFEPFFVPRAPVLKDAPSVPGLQRLGLEIFNQRPGQGLAFIVASGCVRDFPVELSGFLNDRDISSIQVGEFLGENYSIAQTLRLEYINSVRLIGTGVVAALAKVFDQLAIPTDMQKIDRLVDGIAQIWWRQHEQISSKDLRTSSDDDKEVQGLPLMKCMQSHDVLSQLMFSAILLHWNLYAPLPSSQKLSPEQWLTLNEGLGVSGIENLDTAALCSIRHVHSLVYNMISHNFYPQLQIWGGAQARPPKLVQKPALTATEPMASGWARLAAGGFPSLAFAGPTTTGSSSYRHLRSILSETTMGGFNLVSPSQSRCQSRADASPMPSASRLPISTFVTRSALSNTLAPPKAIAERVHDEDNKETVEFGGRSPRNGFGSQDMAWLALYQGLLFLAPKSQPWAPYAFLYTSGLSVRTDSATLTLTLLPQRTSVSEDKKIAKTHSSSSLIPPTPTTALPARLQVVFLLPDARWQVLEVPRFQVSFSDAQQLEVWSKKFEGSEAGPSPSSQPSPRAASLTGQVKRVKQPPVEVNEHDTDSVAV